MNRRGFLGSLIKTAGGILIAEPALKRVTTVVMGSGLRPNPAQAIWRDVNFKIVDLTGYATYSQEFLKDCYVDVQMLMAQSRRRKLRRI